MRVSLLLAFFCASFAITYKPTWDSLDKRPTPKWYDDAKFGIFIHWGVFSVPAWAPVGEYAEWYWSRLAQGSGPTYDFHVKTYGANFQYQDFAPRFKAELWNASQWADIFFRSGAKYIVPTSKHHEGYTMWPSAQSWNWNSFDVGPQRDLIKELFDAVRARGMHAALYYSLYEWFNPLYTGPTPHEYVDEVMLPQLKDLVLNYQPDIIWTDGEWEQTAAFWNSTQFLAWLFNEAPNKDTVVVNDRWGSGCRGVHGGIYTAEYSDQYWLDHKWEENSGIDIFSYGLNRQSTADDYLTVQYLINLLIRTVSFGGNLLLNVGPHSDGTIPPIMQERILSIGSWLNVNGDAIYFSRHWRVQNETSTLFYTFRPDQKVVYAITTSWPTNNKLQLASPQATADTAVSMLGYGALPFSSNAGGITVQFPQLTVAQLPCQYAWVLKLTNVS